MGVMDAYFSVCAAVVARNETDRLYREAVKLEPDVGPWGFKIKSTYVSGHLGVPRGFTEVSFNVRGHDFQYFLTGTDDLRSIHLQALMKLTRPKAKSVPRITGTRADLIIVDDIYDHAHELTRYPAR